MLQEIRWNEEEAQFISAGLSLPSGHLCQHWEARVVGMPCCRAADTGSSSVQLSSELCTVNTALCRYVHFWVCVTCKQSVELFSFCHMNIVLLCHQVSVGTISQGKGSRGPDLWPVAGCDAQQGAAFLLSLLALQAWKRNNFVHVFYRCT